jgi:hypothetical protein
MRFLCRAHRQNIFAILRWMKKTIRLHHRSTKFEIDYGEGVDLLPAQRTNGKSFTKLPVQ